MHIASTTKPIHRLATGKLHILHPQYSHSHVNDSGNQYSQAPIRCLRNRNISQIRQPKYAPRRITRLKESARQEKKPEGLRRLVFWMTD